MKNNKKFFEIKFYEREIVVIYFNFYIRGIFIILFSVIEKSLSVKRYSTVGQQIHKFPMQ
jgi:hypothetical protein